MPNFTRPVIGEWYKEVHMSNVFEVIALDEKNHTVEIQDFDGSVDEIDIEQWYILNLETTTQPEDCSGALDVGELDDFGTEITDTNPEDWQMGPQLSEAHEFNGYDQEEQISDWLEN